MVARATILVDIPIKYNHKTFVLNVGRREKSIALMSVTLSNFQMTLLYRHRFCGKTVSGQGHQVIW